MTCSIEELRGSPWHAVHVSLILLSSAVPALAKTPSHCSPSERIIYSCQIKDSAKVVSLCASKQLNSQSGYLQYRFGRPGRVELEFPKERQNSQEQFRYAHYFRFQVDRTELSFKNNGFEYVLYDYHDGEEKPSKSENGVRVQETSLLCGSGAINRLSKLEKVVPCDEASALAAHCQ